MKIQYPDNEIQRLEALFRFRILNTEEDPTYTIITGLAATIMETPIAMISLVNSQTAHGMATVGMPQGSSPRELSFCTHSILTPDDPMIIKDATLDERFANNPYVVGDPKIRFYLGVPLVTVNKEAIGSICAVDSVPRKDPTKFQLESMKALSKLVMAQLELREFIFDVHDQITTLSMQEKDADTVNVYKKLNDKCDRVLDKIRARASKKAI